MAMSPEAAGRRLTHFPSAHVGPEGVHAESQIQSIESRLESSISKAEDKSSIMKAIAQAFIELDDHEKQHVDALMQEEKQSRERYIAQFQSIASKCRHLEEEFTSDAQFRRDFSEALSRYGQEQRKDVEEFAQDMESLRDLDRLVRGALPAQLEALAGLAHDIQASLKTKADAMATKARLQMIEQRLTRLEQGTNTKADASDLQYLEDRMDKILATRDRLASTFHQIGDNLLPPRGGR